MGKCVGFDQNFFFSSTDRVTLVAEERRERKVTRYCDMYSSSKVKQLFTTMHRSSIVFNCYYVNIYWAPHLKMRPMHFTMAAVYDCSQLLSRPTVHSSCMQL